MNDSIQNAPYTEWTKPVGTPIPNEEGLPQEGDYSKVPPVDDVTSQLMKMGASLPAQRDAALAKFLELRRQAAEAQEQYENLALLCAPWPVGTVVRVRHDRTLATIQSYYMGGWPGQVPSLMATVLLHKADGSLGKREKRVHATDLQSPLDGLT